MAQLQVACHLALAENGVYTMLLKKESGVQSYSGFILLLFRSLMAREVMGACR